MTRPPNPELVNELLTITTKLIAEKGAAAVTMREIAALAGVTPTTIHYYFGDKRGLFEAARRRAIAELDSAVSASLEASAEAAVQLRQVATAFFEWSLANPRDFALIFDDLPLDAALPEALGRHDQATGVRLQEVLSRGLARGELVCGDPQARAAVIYATLFGLVDLCLKKRLPEQHLANPAVLLEDALRVLLGALEVAPVVPLALAPVVPLALAPVVPISGSRALSDDELEELAAAGPEWEQPEPPSGIFTPGEQRGS